MNMFLNNSPIPYTIGFERLFDQLEEFIYHNKKLPSYPPYNIKKDGENFTIEMALAGFSKDDIEVTVTEDILTISSNKESSKKDELYRGISDRKFTRNFSIADDIVVKSAELKNGLLTIQLEREIPEEKKPRKIKIG
jgi:molecular chaperone IbpA